MSRFILNPNLLGQLEHLLAPYAEQMAAEIDDFLVEKLSDENAPSSPGDYPAKVSGALVQAISHREVTPNHWQAGAFDAPPEAFWLEYPPPPGAPFAKTTDRGARPWASKALNDPELHERIQQRLKRLA